MLAFESISCAIKTFYGFFSTVSANDAKQVNRAQAILCQTFFKKVFTLYKKNKKTIGEINDFLFKIYIYFFNPEFSAFIDKIKWYTVY